MPHVPDRHADHDRLLVAAYAAGDAGGADLEQAAALVAGCPDCAALHHDLRAIAAALPSLPAPVRPRDFRLTPEQAASHRPSRRQGWLARLAGPRFSFATPLGTGLATLGIAGLLLAGSLGVPVASAPRSGGTSESMAAVPASPAASAGAVLEAPADVSGAGTDTSGDDGNDTETRTATGLTTDTGPAGAEASGAPEAGQPAPEAQAGPAGSEVPGLAGAGDASAASSEPGTLMATGPADEAPSPAAPAVLLPLLSFGLLLAGLLMIGLRTAGRRLGA